MASSTLVLETEIATADANDYHLHQVCGLLGRKCHVKDGPWPELIDLYSKRGGFNLSLTIAELISPRDPALYP